MEKKNNIPSIVDERRFLRVENLDTMGRKRWNQIVSRSNKKMEEIMPIISSIVNAIRERGDKALLEYTEKFDHVKMPASRIIVKNSEIKDAYKKVNNENNKLIKYMQDSIDCIRAYHEAEKSKYIGKLRKWEEPIKANSWKKDYERIKVGQIYNSLKRIGLYVPGGNAVLFTTALMGITPAKVARVREIVVASPPSRNGDIDPKIIVASDLAGADLIIRAGGSQAIAALACGTKTIPKVDKIFGPGNIFVTATKSYVASNGMCSIDFLAGPSEIVVIADQSADAQLIARDMISQSEHDINSCAILLTDSDAIAADVRRYIGIFLSDEGGSRTLNELAATSLSKYGAIIKVKHIHDAMNFSNDFAPEHLEIMTRNPGKWVNHIRNAGTVCLGIYSPVAISDYVCPNHILPTGGSARYASGINMDMFFKKTSQLKVSGNMMNSLKGMVAVLSDAEGLYNQHGLSVEARVDYIKRKRNKS